MCTCARTPDLVYTDQIRARRPHPRSRSARCVHPVVVPLLRVPWPRSAAAGAGAQPHATTRTAHAATHAQHAQEGAQLRVLGGAGKAHGAGAAAAAHRADVADLGVGGRRRMRIHVPLTRRRDRTGRRLSGAREREGRLYKQGSDLDRQVVDLGGGNEKI